MFLKVYNDDGTVSSHKIIKEDFSDKDLKELSFIASSSKESNALDIFQSYFNNKKAILYDGANKILSNKIAKLNSNEFSKKEFSLIYFTSGSTGQSVAALKTKENIESEIAVLSEVFKKYKIKKVLVTVPFIHLYGSLAGLFYPYLNDIDIELKEHFLPNDLLDMCEENVLVVTTPLYIKALNKLSTNKNLSKTLFLSSTAPLDPKEAKAFNKKYQSDVIQIFGSTETGGIAYKTNDESIWTPLKSVEISSNKNGELKVKSPFISHCLYENDFVDTNGEIQTFDYIEMVDEKFRLVGRSSQILKLAGKRYSTIQIEDILESQEKIDKALVYVKNDTKSLRGEVLDITLETKEEFLVKDIKKLLQSKLSNLKFAIDLHIVEKIPTSSIGKKLRI